MARRGQNLKPSANLLCAEFHIAQSAGMLSCCHGIESHAVVAYFETDASIRALEQHPGLFSVRMPQAIAQGLARDVQDVLRLLRGEPCDGQRIHLEAEAQCSRCADSLHQAGKLGTQIRPAQNRGPGPEM